jgi:polyisoprenoid-binding protein YceI
MITATALRAGRWELVPARTSARFAVHNFGVATVHGQIPVTAAWVDVDAAGQATAVHAELDFTLIDTGNPRRDRDLRKPRLLDTVHHPALTFDGTAAGMVVDGVLTGRSATRVSLDVTSISPGDAGTVTAHGTTVFDRAALGVRAPRFLIGRRIAAVIDITFAPPSVHPPERSDARSGEVERRPLNVNLNAGDGP